MERDRACGGKDPNWHKLMENLAQLDIPIYTDLVVIEFFCEISVAFRKNIRVQAN
jgi:hypothetical protein